MTLPRCFVAMLLLVAGFVALARANDTADSLLPAGLCYATGAEGERIIVPLESTDVVLDVKPGLVEAEVTQTFTNRTGGALEATYLYPLPPGVTITSLELHYADRVITSVVREKQAAKEEYEAAKTEGRKAALLEQHDPALFSTSVANFMPGETVRVVLRYIEPTPLRADGIEVRFPMVTARKYFPSEPGAGSPGGSAPTPAQSPQAGHYYAFDIFISGFPVERVDSPSHGIVTEYDSGGRARVRLAEDIVVPDRDFVLQVASRPLRQAAAFAVTQRAAAGEYGVVTAFPPLREYVSGSAAPGGRDYLFLVDHSGSMGDVRMLSAKLGVQGCLLNLSAADRFQIVIFDSTYAFYRGEWVQATAAEIAAAVAYVGGIKAESGTEMQPALGASLDFIQRQVDGRPKAIIFLTDGEVGNESSLIAMLESRIGDTRVFPVGIGDAPNAYLIRKMAEAGRGIARFIADDSAVASEMAALFAVLDAPVWTDLHLTVIDAAGVPVNASILPRRLGDVFAGMPSQAAFFIPAGTAASVRLEATEAGRPVRVDIPIQGPERGSGLEKQFGRALYAEEESRRRRAEAPAEREASAGRLRDIALQYQLVTEFTSRVAIDRVIARPSGAPLTSTTVAQQAPGGGGQGNVLELSPFVVETAEEGYVTGNTVCGTRLRSDLRDVSSAITVVTEQFVKDVGATNKEDLLAYTSSTDVSVALPAQVARLEELPFGVISDPAFVSSYVMSLPEPGRIRMEQHRATFAEHTQVLARWGDAGYEGIQLDSAQTFLDDQSLAGRVILTQREDTTERAGALLDVRKNIGGGSVQAGAQWQRWSDYGTEQLVRASLKDDWSDHTWGQFAVAWHEVERDDAGQFRRDSPTAQTDDLGFMNLDLATAATRRLGDASAQAWFGFELARWPGRHVGALGAIWHRQESDWVASVPVERGERDNLGLEFVWQAANADRSVMVEVDAAWTEHRLRGQTGTRSESGRISVDGSWQPVTGWRLFARGIVDESMPWISTGIFAEQDGQWLAVSPATARSRSLQAGVEFTSADDRISIESMVWTEQRSNVAFRDWAWERDHGASEVLPDGRVRDPFSYATWPQWDVAGWAGEIFVTPMPGFATLLRWQLATDGDGPYQGGNQRASFFSSYRFQSGLLRGLTVGGGLTARNALRFNDGYTLEDSVRVDLLLRYELRLGSRMRAETQLNVQNATGAPAQPTRFGIDHGPRIVLSQSLEF